MDAPQIEDISEDDDREFWLLASMPAMEKIWGNEEDDVYAKLLDQEER